MNLKVKVLLFIALAILLLLGWRIVATAGEFSSSSSIDKWRVGGLSKKEAASLITKEAEAKNITLVWPGGRSVEKVSIKPKAREAVERAWEAEDRGVIDRLAGSGGKQTALYWQYNKRDIQEIIKKALSQERASSEAYPIWRGLKITIQEGRSGWSVHRKKLERRLKNTLSSGGGSVTIPGKKTEPKMKTAKDYWREHPTQLLVDQGDYRLYRYKHGKLKESYPVAVGMPGFETPNGLWSIQERTIDPAWLPPDWAGAQAGILVPGGTPENPLVARWMGIGDGVGIHGTWDVSSLGSSASHGCVRMDPEQVKVLYEYVPLGTPLLIRS